MHISASTVDDLLHHSIERVIAEGSRIQPSQGAALEVCGVLLELTNPRARLSRSESKGKAFSCLGEFLWYMSGTDDPVFVTHYISFYKRYKDLHGAYGPRLFKMHGKFNQVETVSRVLKDKKDTRHAVIQLFDAGDLAGNYDDVPCTCSLQFFLRNNELHMMTHMRSNDIFKGLAHDIFAFTMLQEILASKLDVQLGLYKHSVGSFHLYDSDRKDAENYLNEGWQSTDRAMPTMPPGDQWPAIQRVLETEKKMRDNPDAAIDITEFDPYWADMVRLLQVFNVCKGAKTTDQLNTSLARTAEIKSQLHARVLSPFIEMREEILRHQLSKTSSVA